MRRLAKNEKICPICGRIFRFKRERGKARRKYCSEDCRVTANRNKARRRNRIGTPATLNLSPNAVKKQLDLIRNNVDTGAKQFVSDKSKRDVVLERMVYDENCSTIREV